MRPSLAIGDFSQATHLSIKALRHYHRIGLLEPADVDSGTGHRRYTIDQIATAQIIRRFRSLDMPLEEIHAVIATPDLSIRNELISGHLSRLEATLARTQEAAASLRHLLQPPADRAPIVIEHHQVAATPVAAVREVLDLEDAGSWFQGALGELYAIVAAQKLPSRRDLCKRPVHPRTGRSHYLRSLPRTNPTHRESRSAHPPPG